MQDCNQVIHSGLRANSMKIKERTQILGLLPYQQNIHKCKNNMQSW